MALNKERNRCEVVSGLQVCAKSLFLIKGWQLRMSWTFITYRGILTIWIVCSALSSWWHVGAVVTSLLEGPGFEPAFLWGVCSHILLNILTYLNMPTEQTNDTIITINFFFLSDHKQKVPLRRYLRPEVGSCTLLPLASFLSCRLMHQHRIPQLKPLSLVCTLSAPKRMRMSHKIEDNKTEATDQRTYDRVTILCWDHCSISVGVLGCGVYTAVSCCKKHSCSCFEDNFSLIG